MKPKNFRKIRSFVRRPGRTTTAQQRALETLMPIFGIPFEEQIINFLKKYIESSRYKTLEKLIIESSQALKTQFKINKITLKIEKPKTAKKYKCYSISVTK